MGRALNAGMLFCILAVQATVAAAQEPPPAGIVGWWPGDGDTADIVGISPVGVFAGTETYGQGQVDQAFQLDGGSWINVGNEPELHVSIGDFTIECWVYFFPGGGDRSIVDKMNPSGVNVDGWRLIRQGNGRFWFGFGGGSGNGLYPGSPTTIISNTPSVDGQWTHIAVTVDRDGDFCLWINGVADTWKSTPATIHDSGLADLVIGRNLLEGSFFNGLIDEVSIYHELLDGTTIGNIVAAGSDGKQKGVVAEQLGWGVEAPETVGVGEEWEVTVRLEDLDGNLATDTEHEIRITLLGGEGTLSGGEPKMSSGGLATFTLSYDTVEPIKILGVGGGLNNTPISNSIFITRRFSNLEVIPDGISFAPEAPQVGELTRIEAIVENAGTITSEASVSFYLGDPDLGGTLIEQLPSAVIPVGESMTFSIDWTPTSGGRQNIYVIAEDLIGADLFTYNNRATRRIHVGAAPEELQVVAGKRDAWPGAQLHVPININNIGANPATIQGITLMEPDWLTVTLLTPMSDLTQPLEVGETRVVLLELNVDPNAPGGPLRGTPLSQGVRISVTTANQNAFEDTLVVKVFDQPGVNVTVTVVDQVTQTPLPGALVAVKGRPGAFQTGPTGEVHLQVPPGPLGLFGYKPGFLAAAGTVDIEGDVDQDVWLLLTPGETLGVQEIVPRQLSLIEIENRGIDLDDPENNAIFDFVVALSSGTPLVLHSVELPISAPAGTVIQFQGFASSEGTPQSGGGPNSGGPGGFGGGSPLVSGTFVYNEFGRTETWMIIPGEVWVLKQFFEIEVIVKNNSIAPSQNPEFIRLENITVDIGFPEGLGLPDLDGVPQQVIQSLPNLNANGGQATARWIVRGDLPGTYQLSGVVGSDLVAFGETAIPVVAGAQSEAFNVTVPQISCEFNAPAVVEAELPFPFDVTVTNMSGATASLVRVRLKAEDLVGCTLDGSDFGFPLPPPDPDDPLQYILGEQGEILGAEYRLENIEPQKSKTAQFLLYAGFSGSLGTFQILDGCGEDPSPSVTVTSTAPEILTQPDGVVACTGTEATFNVVATGSGNLTYSWRKVLGPEDFEALTDDERFSGTTAATLVISPVQEEDAGIYDVVVGEEVESAPATLTVLPLPRILNNLNPEYIVTQGRVLLYVIAEDPESLTFQWRRDLGEGFTDIQGATDSELLVHKDDAGMYQVVVSNDCGSTTSRDAVVIANSIPTVSVSASETLWESGHRFVDISSALEVQDDDGDPLTLSFQVFSDETEVPSSGDGTGRHHPDFKEVLEDGSSGLWVRSERRGGEDGRFYILVVTADDGRGGTVTRAVTVAVCPHDQNQESLDDVLAQAALGEAQLQAAIDSGGALPPAGLYEHGLAEERGPFQ